MCEHCSQWPPQSLDWLLISAAMDYTCLLQPARAQTYRYQEYCGQLDTRWDAHVDHYATSPDLGPSTPMPGNQRGQVSLLLQSSGLAKTIAHNIVLVQKSGAPVVPVVLARFCILFLFC